MQRSDQLTQTNKIDHREYWAAHIEKWQLSNLKQKAYCTQAGISYHSFVHWKTILSKETQSSIAKSFLPVNMIKPESALHSNKSRSIEIKLVSGHVVYLPDSLGAKEIGQILQFLSLSHD